MKLESVSVEYSNPLVNRYLNNFPEAAHLYEHDPGDPASFINRYQVIMRDYHIDRKEMVRILKEYNYKLQCGDKTRENLEKLAADSATVVITGQQAGVFTGPLYAIYKAVTAVQLAGELTVHIGRDVIPMFWVAAEDHDFAEINHIDLTDKEKNIARLRLDYDPQGRYSAGHIPVSEAVFRLIGELKESTTPSEWKDGLINKLTEQAHASDNLAEWFARIMTWLFQEHGLVMINPQDRQLRRLWSGAFQEFLSKSEQVSEMLKAGAERVRRLGSEPQVKKEEANVNMFIYVKGERLPLLRSGNVYTIRGGEEQWSLEELLEVARETPELLSPNVVLRPVAQDILLPIMAYVAGPGEISYYALYRDIYRIFNQQMPVIYPRVNITVIEKGIAKNMAKYGVEFNAGPGGLHRKRQEQLENRDILGIDVLFDAYTTEIETSFREFAEKIIVIDKELDRHGNESLHKILHQLEYFRKKTHKYHRKSCDTLIKRFDRLESQIFPRNNWQERVFNIFPYLFKYGPDFMNDLIQLPLLADNRHKLLYL